MMKKIAILFTAALALTIGAQAAPSASPSPGAKTTTKATGKMTSNMKKPTTTTPTKAGKPANGQPGPNGQSNSSINAPEKAPGTNTPPNK